MENKIIESIVLLLIIGLNFYAIWFPYYREYKSKKPSIDLSKEIYNRIKSKAIKTQ